MKRTYISQSTIKRIMAFDDARQAGLACGKDYEPKAFTAQERDAIACAYHRRRGKPPAIKRKRGESR